MLGRRPRNRRRSTGDVNQRRQQPQPHPDTPDLASTTATAPGLAARHRGELRYEVDGRAEVVARAVAEVCGSRT